MSPYGFIIWSRITCDKVDWDFAIGPIDAMAVRDRLRKKYPLSDYTITEDKFQPFKGKAK